MNSFEGHIATIEVSGNMSLVTVAVDKKQTLKAIVIETPETASYLKSGSPVHVLFKETEVVIGSTKNHEISLQNRIPGTINHIEQGLLLSKLEIQTKVGIIRSIISTAAVLQLGLKKGKEVIAMIKLNELMLSP
jgi:molybdopterin-binding protein